MWTKQFEANALHFIILCIQRLRDQYRPIHQWLGIISQRSSCILYKDLHQARSQDLRRGGSFLFECGPPKNSIGPMRITGLVKYLTIDIGLL